MLLKLHERDILMIEFTYILTYLCMCYLRNKCKFVIKKIKGIIVRQPNQFLLSSDLLCW